jgi:CheY-like chemotaxis protein
MPWQCAPEVITSSQAIQLPDSGQLVLFFVPSWAGSFIFHEYRNGTYFVHSIRSSTLWNLRWNRSVMLLPKPELPAMSVLLIDSSKRQRMFWTDQLKSCSSDYEIVEAEDGQSGLALYRSRRFDCVVLELSLPDQSGFSTLVELVPAATRPQIAVVVLTLITHRGVWDLAKQSGAYTCLHKDHTTGEDLDKAIQRAVAFVGQMPKEERDRSL